MRKLIILSEKGKEPRPDKTNVWWKVDKYFIDEENIHSLTRMGRKTKVRMYHGEDLVVNTDYDKLSGLLPKARKN
ncbi:MAG TPA: hypothetical protein VII99_11295 [Bacteroidia bacterium]